MTTTVSEPLAARLARVATSSAKAILNDLGVYRVVVTGPRMLVPPPGETAVAGRARTLRFLPAREDVSASPGGGLNRKLMDLLEPGDVVVIDAGGSLLSATIGDMLAARAANRGAEAVFSDGLVRDIGSLETLGLAIYARGTHPDPSARALTPWDIDVPVQCGGVLVRPGDWMLVDADSAIVVPEALAEQVAERGAEMNAADEFSQRLLAAGFPLAVAYPISPKLKDDFTRYQQDGTLPTQSEFEARG